MKTSEKIVAWACENGLTLQSVFVPFSISRNRDNKISSINYIITLKSASGIISTDYSLGCGHVKYVAMKSVNWNCQRVNAKMAIAGAVGESCETGKWAQDYRLFHDKNFPAPTIDEVLYSLQIDSDVINYDNFEQWANGMGYDSDSIKDFEIYKACEKIAREFSKLLTKKQREELAELLQDY